MSSYIIAGSADSIDTAYVISLLFSANKLPAESKPNTKISISESLSNIPPNGNNIYNKSAESTVSSKSPIPSSTPSMAKSSVIKMPS